MFANAMVQYRARMYSCVPSCTSACTDGRSCASCLVTLPAHAWNESHVVHCRVPRELAPSNSHQLDLRQHTTWYHYYTGQCNIIVNIILLPGVDDMDLFLPQCRSVHPFIGTHTYILPLPAEYIILICIRPPLFVVVIVYLTLSSLCASLFLPLHVLTISVFSLSPFLDYFCHSRYPFTCWVRIIYFLVRASTLSFAHHSYLSSHDMHANTPMDLELFTVQNP